MVKESITHNDGLLTPWLETLRTRGEDAAESELALLIEAHIEPVIRSVIRFKLRLGSAGQADEDDLAQEALAQWLAELRKLGARPDDRSISDARGLAATIAYRVCYNWLRRRSPRRHALRNRLQYVLTRQAGLDIWHGAGQSEKLLIAGFAAWRGRAQAPSERLRQLPGAEKFLAQTGRLIASGQDAKLNDLLAAIFDYVGGPVEFDELVKTVAVLLRVTDLTIESIDADPGGAGYELEDKEADVAWRVEKRVFLQRLWEEVRQLPRQQRVALLLNLRDPEGRGCIALFPAIEIATLRQLAEAMEMSAEKLAELWNELPLEDARIAELLQLTRQQVINARKAARERLARRLKGFF
jgi:DNA-directed RNA polymerase specialized sigma24 family protein